MDAVIEGSLAAEASLIVLDTLELLVQTASIIENLQSMLGRVSHPIHPLTLNTMYPIHAHSLLTLPHSLLTLCTLYIHTLSLLTLYPLTLNTVPYIYIPSHS